MEHRPALAAAFAASVVAGAATYAGLSSFSTPVLETVPAAVQPVQPTTATQVRTRYVDTWVPVIEYRQAPAVSTGPAATPAPTPTPAAPTGSPAPVVPTPAETAPIAALPPLTAAPPTDTPTGTPTRTPSSDPTATPTSLDEDDHD